MLALCACSRDAPTVVVTPCAPISSAVDSTTHAQLVDAREAVWRAYYGGDTARLEELLPEPMIGMGTTRADIIAQSAEFAHGRKLVAIEFSCDEFYVNGDVAVVFSNYRVQHDLNGHQLVDAGRAIELFERRGGRWVNPSWHLDEAE